MRRLTFLLSTLAATVIGGRPSQAAEPARTPARPAALGEPAAAASFAGLPPKPTLAWHAALGGGLPGRGSAVLSGEVGVAPMVAGRLSLALLLPSGQARALTAVMLLGPSLVIDVLRDVPRLYLQAGLAVAPARPSLAWGLSYDRFVSLHFSVHVTLRALYVATDPVRGDLLVGLGYTQ